MNKNEFLAGVNELELAYNQKFTKEKLQIWYKMLKNVDFETYIKRIEKLVAESKYMPTVAEILDKKPHEFEQRDYSKMDFNKFYVNS